MNGNMTPQRTPQRSPQRPQQRPPQRPQGAPGRAPQPMPSDRRTERRSKYSGAFMAIVIGTVTLLIISLVVLCVTLAIGGLEQKKPAADNGGSDGGKQTEQSGGGGQAPSVNRVPYTLSLPAATAAGAGTIDGTGVALNGSSLIRSEAAILVSLTQQTTLASKNADVPVHPASMTKVMTLLLACEKAKAANDLLTVKDSMLSADGSGVLVKETIVLNQTEDESRISPVGKAVTVEDALYLIIYKSDTTSCLLIAEYIAGSEAAFVELMNQRAKEMGLTQTSFVNCTGLTEKNDSHNTTTCREMATIMAHALKNPVAKKILTATAKYNARIYEDGAPTGYYVPVYSDWKAKQLVRNKQDISKAGSVTISGGKTGYEVIPTSCFVTYGIGKNGAEYVCVTVGKTLNGGSDVNNSTSTDDTRTLYIKYAE